MNYQHIKLLTFFLAVLLLNIGCGAVRNTVRENGQKSFDSIEWKQSDSFDRGRMLGDIFKNRTRYINGKTEKELVEMLGEPDKKKDLNGKTVWLYNLEFKNNPETKYLAITIVSGVGMYGVENQRGQMTTSDW